MGQHTSEHDTVTQDGVEAPRPTRTLGQQAGDYMKSHGACAKGVKRGEVDPEWFVADQDDYVDSYNQAVLVCATCPLAAQDACLTYAHYTGEDHGVWGGIALGRTLTAGLARWRVDNGWQNRHGHSLREAFLRRGVSAIARARFEDTHGRQPTRSEEDRREVTQHIDDVRADLEHGRLPFELLAAAQESESTELLADIAALVS